MLASSFQVLWAPETSFLELLEPSLWGDGNQAVCTLYTSPSSPLIGSWAKAQGDTAQAVSRSTCLFLMFLRMSVREKKPRHLHLGEVRGGVCVQGGQAQSGLRAGRGQAEHSFQRLLSPPHHILGQPHPSEAAHSRAGCDCRDENLY